MNLRIFHGPVPADVLEQVAEIYIQCFTGPPRFEKWTAEEVKTHILRFLDNGGDCFIIEEDDGSIASFAVGIAMADYFNKEELKEQGAREDSYYFAELGTRPTARGKGYGTALHQAREAEARRRQLKLCNVRVRTDNDVNIKLLKRLGFNVVGNYTGTIKDVVSAKLILEKPINRNADKA